MGKISRRGRLGGLGLIGALILLLSAPRSEAGSIGDPTAIGRSNILSQFNLEFDLTQRKVSSVQPGFSGQTNSNRILLQGVYGLTPSSDLYLRAGVADLEAASRGFNSSLGPAFGGGGRWTLMQKGDLRIGAGIQFLEYFSDNNSSLTSRVNWTELEAFLGGEIQGVERFTPYFGVSFSKAVGKFKGGSGATVRSSNFTGLFVGAEFQIYKEYYFSTEARLINENSLTIRLNYHL